MSARSWDEHLACAVSSVTQSLALSETVRRELARVSALLKDDRSPVTLADFGVQAVVSHLLARRFPDIPLVAEEDTDLLEEPSAAPLRAELLRQVQSVLPALDERTALAAIARGRHDGGARGVFWTLDPIDGTKGFLRGNQYATALALVVDGSVELGVLGCPNLPREETDARRGCVLHARRGSGAFLRALDAEKVMPIRVSATTALHSATFCESFEGSHSSHGDAARVAQALGITTPPVRMDSQCKYAVVARGGATFYMRMPADPDYREKIWDHAAGAIVVEEAGGSVTDVDGEPLDFSVGRLLARNRGIVASNGAIHGAILRAIGSLA